MSAKLGKAYFRDQLRRNPINDFETIIALRAAALGIEARAVNQWSRRPPELIGETQSTLQSIRSEFWTLPTEQLLSRLASIDVTLFPELAVPVERIRAAAEARADFVPLAMKLKKNTHLLNHLRSSITAQPRDIGGLKEIVARDLLGPKGRQYKKAAHLIKAEFPRVYAIDSAWIDGLIDSRRPGQSWFNISTGDLPIPGWVVLVLVITVVRGCAMAVQ